MSTCCSIKLPNATKDSNVHSRNNDPRSEGIPYPRFDTEAHHKGPAKTARTVRPSVRAYRCRSISRVVEVNSMLESHILQLEKHVQAASRCHNPTRPPTPTTDKMYEKKATGRNRNTATDGLEEAKEKKSEAEEPLNSSQRNHPTHLSSQRSGTCPFRSLYYCNLLLYLAIFLSLSRVGLVATST
jgi:hypothetical protein